MVTIQLTGHITENGELQVELPEGLPPGNVQITIEMPNSVELPWEARAWTPEELAQLSSPDPKTGAEIVAWLQEQNDWLDTNGMAGDQWIEAVRRKEQERRA
jgi:hypothetical protein